ncbi:DUF2079 domain-containing protein [Facklamia lactis]|uniref:DUF2079 domain-containing protein n=1 Tax=Facklamia lactis TaxID=2749967 RepID=UPI0018CE2F88|nr:DUF2079 domain-containing protein [Facklamia lactis]
MSNLIQSILKSKVILYVLNGYLMVAISLLMLKPYVLNFTELNNFFSLSFLFIAVLTWACLFALLDKILSIGAPPSFIFHCLLLSYFILVILISKSILICLGFLIFLCSLVSYLYLNKSRLFYSSLLTVLVAFLKIIWLVLNQQFYLNEKFKLDIAEQDIQYGIIIVLSFILAFIIVFLGDKTKLITKIGTKKSLQILSHALFLFGLLYVVFLCIAMYARAGSFSAPNFDMGIFTQAFANMAKGLGPVTTLERDKVLSHFAVHVSPILYTILPFYKLWPSPENLEILQVLITMSGILPLALILKEFDFSRLINRLCLLLYIVLPTLTTSHFYDFHENCFLAPLILWVIYSNLKGWRWKGLIFTILTLMIKEDAIIYLVSIFLYFTLQDRYGVFRQHYRFYLISQLILPLIYFSLCLYWLQNYGDGAMTTRFTNFMLPGQDSLREVVVNAITNPTFVLSSIFIQRKLSYLVLILACLGFLPLIQRNWETYLLMLPLLVINLLSDYLYQVDFAKQYNYGSSVLLIFMALVSLKENGSFVSKNKFILHKKLLRPLLSSAVLCSSLVLVTFLPRKVDTIQLYLKEKEDFQQLAKELKEIPRDAKVLAYSFYTPHLSDIYYLYDAFYHNEGRVDPEIDLVVVPRSMLQHYSSKEAQVVSDYYQLGYRESDRSTDQLYILELKR